MLDLNSSEQANPRSGLGSMILLIAAIAAVFLAFVYGREGFDAGLSSESEARRSAESDAAQIGGPQSGSEGAKRDYPHRKAGSLPAGLNSVGDVESREGPGAGILVGRLVEDETGISVGDAGVTILELDRRALSHSDGQFRFDGVSPGRYTLVILPTDGYIANSIDVSVRLDGLDLGPLSVFSAAPPVLVVPNLGGRIAACGHSQLELEPDSILIPTAIQFTCIENASGLPAPAPAGRLPLAAIDIAPGDLALIQAGRLRVDLPFQPRYAQGVSLDLLRLDLNKLIWRPAGELKVDAGGRSASGEITALGTYLVAAPPFGTFLSLDADQATITRMSTSASTQGELQTQFASGKELIFLGFEYAGTFDSPLRIRTTRDDGNVVFEKTLRLSGAGRESIPMPSDDGTWKRGSYLTTFFFDDSSSGSIEFDVGIGVGPVAAISGGNGLIDHGFGSGLPWPAYTGPIAPVLEPPPAAKFPAKQMACKPKGWWPRLVQAGESLTRIAYQTGTNVPNLMRSNCLKSEKLYAGQWIYVPSVPKKIAPPAAPAMPTAPPPMPSIYGNDGQNPADGTPNPGLLTPPAILSQPKATRPPDPTLVPRPEYPNSRPVVPTASSGDSSSLSPPPTAAGSAPLAPGIRSAPRPTRTPEQSPPKSTRPADPTLAPRPTLGARP